MKIQTKEFKEALNNVSQFVNFKSTIPVATYIGLKLKDNTLTINAQAIEGVTSSFINVKNTKEENYQLMITEADTFKKVILSIKTLEFNLSVKDNNALIIKTNKKEFIISVIEYETQSYTKNNVIQKIENIKFKELQDSLNLVNEFSASDELRPIMNGVNINPEHFVATDSHFLLRQTNTSLRNIEEGIVINKEFIHKLSKIKLDKDAFINIIITDKTFTIMNVNFITTTRLIDGNYPNYKAILPSYFNSLVLDKLDLINALKDASITSNQASLLCTLESKENGTLDIKSKNIDFKQSFESNLEIADLKGDDIRIGLHINKLLTILNKIEGDNVVIEYDSPQKAILIYAEEDEKTDNLFLLMPMLID